MALFKILMYEDDQTWKTSFEFNMSPKVLVKNHELKILHKLDGDTIMQDLEYCPHIILVDYDLIHLTGDEIIESISSDPNYQRTSIFFYSAGESISRLTSIAQGFNLGIRCFTKEGDELEKAILNKLPK